MQVRAQIKNFAELVSLFQEGDANCAQRGLSESISSLPWEKSGRNRCSVIDTSNISLIHFLISQEQCR